MKHTIWYNLFMWILFGFLGYRLLFQSITITNNTTQCLFLVEILSKYSPPFITITIYKLIYANQENSLHPKDIESYFFRTIISYWQLRCYNCFQPMADYHSIPLTLLITELKLLLMLLFPLISATIWVTFYS